MFESLKRLFRRRASSPSQPEFKVPPLPERAQSNRRTSPAVAEAAPPERGDATSNPISPDSIQVSLRSVVLKLPETLKNKAANPPSGGVRISIPASKILPQLQQGTVRIPFGDLRKASPPGVFADGADRDHTLVDLPLQEILQQLKPDQLPRRLRQKRVEIPDEVVPIFTPQRGQSSVRIAKPSTPEPTRHRTEPPVSAPPSAPPLRSPPASAAPTTSTPAPLPVPSALRSHNALPQPPPIRPSTPLPTLTPPAQQPPSRPAVVSPTQKPAHAPAPSPAPKAPAPATQAPAPPITTTGDTDYISVPLAAVTPGWPEPIRNALAGLNAPDATLQLPAGETEQALKRGKVVFSWKRLRPLVKPSLKTALAPALDELQLELPLPAIAPLFMAQRKSATVQRKYDVGEDIPDVFSGRGLATPPATAPAAAPSKPAPAATPPSQTVKPPEKPLAESAPAIAFKPAPVAPAPTPAQTETPKPAPAPIPAPAPPAPAARPVGSEPRDIGDVFGQPGRKNWAPAEIAQRTATLPGVAGAVITMQDGLLIAGHLPSGLNGETIAAFVPQMFSRMTQYSKELKFGESDHITIVINDIPLRIYRAGSVYFAALGRSREQLPDSHLHLIASHLGPQSK